MKTHFKLTLITLAVLVLIAGGACLWLRNTTIVVHDKLLADCTLLNERNIEFPYRLEITKLGSLTCDVDASWIRKNFEKILRAKLPGDGEGTNRYTYRDFALTTDVSGSLVMSVHVTHKNYRSFDRPAPTTRYPLRKKREYVLGTTIDADVVVTVKPEFQAGYPETVTSVVVRKTGSSGLGDLVNNALPKIWFSLDRKIHTAQNSANHGGGPQLLDWHTGKDEAGKRIIKDVLERELLVAEQAQFRAEGGDRLFLTVNYKFNEGFKTYRELFAAYKNLQSSRPADGK